MNLMWYRAVNCVVFWVVFLGFTSLQEVQMSARTSFRLTLLVAMVLPPSTVATPPLSRSNQTA